MYGKAFESTFSGSMVGAGSHVFSVWFYVTAFTRHTDWCVELHPKILAVLLGDTEQRIKDAIAYLEAPDPDSRSTAEEGRRLVKRAPFQYFVVNGEAYHKLRHEEERREYSRSWMKANRKSRAVNPDQPRSTPSKPLSTPVHVLTMLTKEEEEEEVLTAYRAAHSSSGDDLSVRESSPDDEIIRKAQCEDHSQTQPSPIPARSIDGGAASTPHLQHDYDGIPKSCTVSGPLAALPPEEDQNAWFAPTEAKAPETKPPVQTVNQAAKIELAPPALTVAEFMSVWNELAGPKFPKCETVMGKRLDAFKQRVKEPYFITHWKTVIANMHTDPFLCGETDRGNWIANPTWLLRRGTVQAQMERINGPKPVKATLFRENAVVDDAHTEQIRRIMAEQSAQESAEVPV